MLLISLFLIVPVKIEIPLVSLLIIFGIGLLNAIGYTKYYQVLSIEKAALIGALVSTHSLVSSFIGFIFFKEALTIGKIIALPVIFISLSLLLLSSKDFKKTSISKRSVFYCFIAVLCWGALFPLFKISRDYMDPITPVILGRFASAILIFPILSSQQKKQIKKTNKRNAILLLALSLANALGFVFYNLAVEKVDISIASPILASYPIISTILAVIFLEEKITKRNLVGIVGIVISLVLLQLNF